MELEIGKNNILENLNEELINKQNNFLETTLGKTINTAFDIGLKILLPDSIEDEIIKIKDTILNNGVKKGIKEVVDSVIETGKKIGNILTGKFDDASQVKEVVEKGGLIDKISEVLKDSINISESKGLINKKTAKRIKDGKKIILDTISENLEKEFSEQISSGKKIKKYIDNWKKYYDEGDFKKMEKEFKKIKKEVNNVMPMEKTEKEIEKIENIHSLIESKNGEFEFTEIEKELIEKLG